MTIREFTWNMAKVLQKMVFPMFDTDTYTPSREDITDVFEVVDDFKPVLIEFDNRNNYAIKLKCGNDFSIDMYINEFPFAYAPRQLFAMKVRKALLKMGFVKMYYTSLVMQCSPELATGTAEQRMRMILSDIKDALMDNDPKILNLVLTTDWNGLSSAMYKSIELFTSLEEFLAYGYADESWISEYISVEFGSLLEFCNKNNHIECIPILLEYKKNHLKLKEEDMEL